MRRSSSRLVPVAFLVPALSMAGTGCYFRGAGALPFAIASTALFTAAVVSAAQPPPPRVVYVPVERPGYTWQPGYWTLQDNNWVWVEGQWIALYPGYAWSTTRWQEMPDGSWQLVQGHWVAVAQ